MVENFLDIAARHNLTSQDHVFEALDYIREHNISNKEQIERVVKNKEYEGFWDKVKDWF